MWLHTRMLHMDRCLFIVWCFRHGCNVYDVSVLKVRSCGHVDNDTLSCWLSPLTQCRVPIAMPNESKLMNRLCQGVIHIWKNNSYVIYCYPYPWWVWCLCSKFFLWQENIGTRGEQRPLWLIPSDIQIWPYVTGANNLWLSVVSLKTASIDHQQILVVLGKSPVNACEHPILYSELHQFADLALGSPPAEKGEVKDRRGSVQRAEAQLGWEGCPCLGNYSIWVCFHRGSTSNLWPLNRENGWTSGFKLLDVVVITLFSDKAI